MRERVRRSRVCRMFVVAILCSAGCTRDPQAPLAPPREGVRLRPSDTVNATVAIRLTHVRWIRVDGSEPAVVDRLDDLCGEVTRVPVGMHIHVAVAVGGAWQIRMAQAQVEPTSAWCSVGAEPLGGARLSSGAYRLVAFLTDATFTSPILDDERLRQIALKVSEPVTVQLREAAPASAPASLTIEALEGQPVVASEAVVTASEIRVSGRYKSVDGFANRVALAACPSTGLCRVAAIARADGSGGWDAGRVRITEPGAAEQRFQLVAFVPAGAIPDGPASLQDLLGGSLATSPFLQIVVTPVEVELSSVTDTDGHIVFSEDGPVPRRQVSPMRLARDVGSVEFIARNQSEQMQFWLLTCAEARSCIAFGPALRTSDGRWTVTAHPVPGWSGSGIRTIRIVGASQSLHGRVLSAERLAHVVTAASTPLTLAVPRSNRASRTVLAVRGGGSDGFVTSGGERLSMAALSHLEVASQRTATGDQVCVGWTTPARDAWRFTCAASRAVQRFPVTDFAGVALETVDDRHLLIVAVTAPRGVIFGDGVERGWWELMATHTSPMLDGVLPHPGLGQRAAIGIERLARKGEDAVVMLLAIVVVSLAALTMVGTRRARLRVRAWWNGVREKANDLADRQSGFTNQLLRECDWRCHRLEYRAALAVERARRAISTGTGRMLMATFAIGEGSMNLFAFYVFQEPTYRTVIMAAAVMLTVPWLAHVLGVQLARSSRWTGPLVVSAGVIGAIVVGGLVAINYVRVVYLMELAPDFVARHPSLSLAFLMINLLVFAGSATVSYATHAANAGATDERRLDEVRERYRIKQEIEKSLTLWAIQIHEKHRRRGRPVRVAVPSSAVDAGGRSGRPEKGPKKHDATFDAARIVVQHGTGNGNGAGGEHDTPRVD